jgi:hypothetical protein
MMVSRAASLESTTADALRECTHRTVCRQEGHGPGEQNLPATVQSADSHGSHAMPTRARRRRTTPQNVAGPSDRVQDWLTSNASRVQSSTTRAGMFLGYHFGCLAVMTWDEGNCDGGILRVRGWGPVHFDPQWTAIYTRSTRRRSECAPTSPPSMTYACGAPSRTPSIAKG